jgi:hypothetical protein
MSMPLVKSTTRELPRRNRAAGRALRATVSTEDTMKMVKSTLLSGVASLIAVAGAQPADLPVKAKAVEYVKVCSMHGVGFY